MKNKKLIYTVTSLYLDYVHRFLIWREYKKRGVTLQAFGKDVVELNINKYSALMDLMVRLNRSNEAENKRNKEDK